MARQVFGHLVEFAPEGTVRRTMVDSIAPPLAPLTVLSPGPRLAGMPSKGVNLRDRRIVRIDHPGSRCTPLQADQLELVSFLANVASFSGGLRKEIERAVYLSCLYYTPDWGVS